jgi:molybdate transport system substrate-binding protein
MNYKKIFYVLLALFLLFSIAGCSTNEVVIRDSKLAEDADPEVTTPEAQDVELIVFAAASMTEVIEEINRAYMEANPHVTIITNLDSSGTLKTQIEEGANCDVYISAAQKAMNELDISADPAVNVGQLDFVLEETRKNILENKVVLAVPGGNPGNIGSFDELATRLIEGDILMAMGNIDVPVGQYTSKILLYYSLDEVALAASGVITYASTVKEVTTQVAEGLVDCGVIYSTDAKAANLEVVDQATKEMTDGQVIYPAAVMKSSKAVDEAKAYLDFLTGPEGAALLEAFGFTPIR